MPKAEETHVIVELTHHSLHALRAVNGRIEAGGECLLENKTGVNALLASVSPDGWAQGLVAEAFIWPDDAGWRISTDTEAMLDRTDEALVAIASKDMRNAKDPFAYATCNADDGRPVTPDGTERWVLAYSSSDSLGRVAETLSELKIESDGAGPAGFARIGAISTALRLAGKGAVVLWDLGNERSHLLLVTPSGIEASVACEVGLDGIFEAVQTALRLKFRGAGERLFFNESYDFTEAGPKVGAIVGAAIKQALSLLPPAEPPAALACLGLTGKQGWFVREVAAAAGTSQWQPELGTLAGELGVTFADAALEASFSPMSVGLFQHLSTRLRAQDAWNPAWVEAEPPAEEIAAAAAPVPEPEPIPEPEPVRLPEPVPEPEPIPEPEPVRLPEPVPEPPPVVRPSGPPPRAKPTLSRQSSPPPPFPIKSSRPSVPSRQTPILPQPGPSSPPPPPTPPARPPVPPPAARPPIPPLVAASLSFPPAPAHPPPPPSFSNPVAAGAPDAPADIVRLPPMHAPVPPPAAPPAPVVAPPPVKVPPSARGVTALPFEAAKTKTGGDSGLQDRASAKSRMPVYIGLIVVAALVFAAIMVVLDARMEKAKAYDLEQQEALAHHVAEERLKEAEQNEKDAAEQARKDLQAAIELTRKQTEVQTRHTVLAEIEEERLSKLPAVLILTTKPIGALVSIDGGAQIISPVKLEGVLPGEHRVHIELAGHASSDFTAQIKGGRTNDLGDVALESVIGTLEVSSSPDNLEFFVRPAAEPAANPLRTGRTPATISDISKGAYLVTFTRPGCRDHVEKVTVQKNSTSPVTTTYANGALELTSDPTGAWVSQDGERLGTTPLSLHDLAPKMANFELTLPGYDPTPVSCEIPEGQTATLSAQLLRKDRIFMPNEVRNPPVASEAPLPSLSQSQRRMGGDVLLALVVERSGAVRDVEIEKSTDDEIGRRCKAAVERWRFQPATAPDGRTVEARIEVPFKFPAAN
jgi:TonB family protein